MGFFDENGYPLINEEQKIRIALSNRARIVMAEDMDVFRTPKQSSFINTVFNNFKVEATSSISLYLSQLEIELNRVFEDSGLDESSKEVVIKKLLYREKQDLDYKIKNLLYEKGESKLYHINDENVRYLLEGCEEERHYSRPGLYMRSVIEEYCSLPFIERERIYRNDIYTIVEQACKEKKVLKIKANLYGKDQLFYVYPYKIMPDSFHTQSYLVCYSRKAEEKDSDRIIASFSMARINKPTALSMTFHLNKEEVSRIESSISTHSPAYLIGKPEQIKVKLTKKGIRSYQTRLYSRPDKITELSSDDTYTFNCAQQQVFNYFLPFGPDAEIISPDSLRTRFKNTYERALLQYSVSQTE